MQTIEVISYEQALIKGMLDSVAGMRSTITYGDLNDKANAAIGENRAAVGIGTPLGNIQRYCRETGVPCLPVMAVKKNTNKPDEEFVNYYRRVHPEAADLSDRDIIRLEQNACRDFTDWQKLLDYCRIVDYEIPAQRDGRKETRASLGVEGVESFNNSLRRELSRDPALRAECLVTKGYECRACGVVLRDRYVGLESDLIHVHHKSPIHDGIRTTVVGRDLVPVCPNCHAVLHSKPGRDECYTINEVREMLGLPPRDDE